MGVKWLTFLVPPVSLDDVFVRKDPVHRFSPHWVSACFRAAVNGGRRSYLWRSCDVAAESQQAERQKENFQQNTRFNLNSHLHKSSRTGEGEQNEGVVAQIFLSVRLGGGAFQSRLVVLIYTNSPLYRTHSLRIDKM